MRLPIILIQLRLRAFDDVALATFIEHLRDTCKEAITFYRAIEAHADEAGRQFGCVPKQSPGNTSGLVIKGRVKVPSSCRFILERRVRTAPRFSPVMLTTVGRRSYHLNGHAQTHTLRLQHIVKRHDWKRVFVSF